MISKKGLVASLVFLVSCDGRAAVPRGATGSLQFVIVVFPDHTHLLYSGCKKTCLQGLQTTKVHTSLRTHAV